MKAAKRTFAFLGIFVFMILSIGFASAEVLTISDEVIPSTISHTDGTFNITFNLSYTGAEDSIIINWTNSIFSDGDASFLFPDTTILNDTTNEVIATIAFDPYQSGNIAGTIQADPTSGGATPATLPFSVAILDSPSFSLSQGTALTQEINGTFNLTNSGNADLTFLFNETTNFGVDFSENNVDLSAGQSLTELIGVFFTTLDNLIFGDNEVKVNVSDSSNGVSTETTFTVEKHFCDSGEVGGNLSIKNVDFENLGDGDDNEWELLDEIEVEVEVDG